MIFTGTFFAMVLWSEKAPQVSVAFSRTAVLGLCGTGLIRGLVAASGSHR